MLYRVQKRDITRAGEVLANAFQHDPIWNKVFEGESRLEKRLPAFFENPVRYCLKYGEVYAPSEALEGVMAWAPGKYADMTVWRVVRSGVMGTGIRIGLNIMKQMATVFKPIAEDRRKHMAGCAYLYVWVFGVAVELRGQGFGRKLIDAVIEKADREGLHLYLETETEENVKMYEHFGFRLLKRVTLPVINLPMWEMVREPQA